MLVEINLLPKKEPKNYMVITILLGTLLLLLVAGFFLFWQGISYQNEIASLDNQISTTQKLAAIEQEKLDGGQSTNSIAALESAVSWVSENPLKTVPIIKQVTALLPQRGFIQTISYAEAGSVNLTVQFDTSRDAAYYLKTLLDSDWFSHVSLSSVTTSQLEDRESSLTSSVQATERDLEDNFENLEDGSPLTTIQLEEGQAAENINIVPRYIGQYQLILNREFINGLNKDEKNDDNSEGGEAS